MQATATSPVRAGDRRKGVGVGGMEFGLRCRTGGRSGSASGNVPLEDRYDRAVGDEAGCPETAEVFVGRTVAAAGDEAVLHRPGDVAS